MTNNRDKGPRRWGAALVVGLAVVAGGATWWYQQGNSVPARAGAPPRPVPVSVVRAARQDVPVYVTGLGTAQASFTIGIHSQVEGIM